MIKLNIILGLLLISCSLSFAAQERANNPALRIMDKVEANYSQIKTISGRILQSRSFQDHQIESKLNFIFKYPDKLYLDYLSPQRQTMIFNGKTCWIYASDQAKAIKADLKEMKNSMLSFDALLGIDIFKDLEKGFNLKVESQNNNQVTISARPKSAGRLISYMKVEIDPERWVISSARIFDKKNNLISQTEYQKYQLLNGSVWFPLEVKTSSLMGKMSLKEETSFHRIELNQEVAEERFNFTPPEGVDVLPWKKVRIR